MGTNFKWKTNDEGQMPAGLGEVPEDSDDPAIHIGKRSAAGLYCWDCGCPCVDEVKVMEGHFKMTRRWSADAVHGGRDNRLDHCPVCCNEPADNIGIGTAGNPAGLELGFSDPYRERPTGVRGASSFNWAQEPARVIQICTRWPGEVLVVDEYGREMTGREFMEALLICPLWFTEMIGVAFS